LPKYLKGKPTDELGNALTNRMPLPVVRMLYRQSLKTAVGEPMDYGLPKPDHKLAEAHPTISAELLPRIGHGDIAVKPNIAEFSGGRTVRFADGSEEEIDLVIYCTGYKISFPFFDSDLISAPDNEIPLYRRVVSPEHPNLYFIGLLQPLGAIMPLAEAQSEWIADVLEGKVSLPDRDGRGWRVATWRRSATRSRSTSSPTCERSSASATTACSGGFKPAARTS
jgi:hypothetical protein